MKLATDHGSMNLGNSVLREVGGGLDCMLFAHVQR